jgi:hypothetical protein
VHPKTGKVCVPIDPDTAWEFDPDDVPTVQQLLQEINEQQQQQDGGASPQQQVSTSVCKLSLASIFWQQSCQRLRECASLDCLLHAL